MLDNLFGGNKIKSAQFAFENAMINYNRGNFELAASQFAEAGRDGHIKSMVFLGNMYNERKLYKVAFAWFKKAADREDPEAQFFVGISENNLSYLIKSSFHKYPRALEALGNICLRKGDWSGAVKYFKKAIEYAPPIGSKTHQRAKAALGHAYWKNKQWEKAKEYLTLASTTEPEAYFDLGIMELQRNTKYQGRFRDAFKYFEQGLVLIQGLEKTPKILELERKMNDEVQALIDKMPSICGSLMTTMLVPPPPPPPPLTFTPIPVYLPKKGHITTEDRVIYGIP